jgi:dihydroflavonol-4-reductase
MLFVMHVLVTGGTGFVGSFAAVRLLQAGHDVRLLVRRPAQVPVTFAPHAVVPQDVMKGDVLDEDAVRRAVQGCDAVVHAAAVFDLDPRHEERLSTNAAATTIVLGAAATAGCDPMVHVSSTVALTRKGGSDSSLPIGDVDQPYARSKIESELRARELQALGHPVVTVYPGAVHGPYDPYLGDQGARMVAVARGLLPVWPTGGSLFVDVREVAAVIAAVMEPGRGPRRFVVPGHHLTGPEYFASVSRAIGRRRRAIVLPPPIARATARTTRAVQRVLPERVRYPADPEGVELMVRDCHLDDTPARRELGVHPRPWQESVDDTVTWLVESGDLPARYRPRRV